MRLSPQRNDTEYGPAASVWTKEKHINKAHKVEKTSKLEQLEQTVITFLMLQLLLAVIRGVDLLKK